MDKWGSQISLTIISCWKGKKLLISLDGHIAQGKNGRRLWNCFLVGLTKSLLLDISYNCLSVFENFLVSGATTFKICLNATLLVMQIVDWHANHNFHFHNNVSRRKFKRPSFSFLALAFFRVSQVCPSWMILKSTG